MHNIYPLQSENMERPKRQIQEVAPTHTCEDLNFHHTKIMARQIGTYNSTASNPSSFAELFTQ